MISADLGVKLEECRRRRLLSQRRLAAASGVSEATIKAIEAGRVIEPQLITIDRLSKALEIDPASIDEFRSALRLPPAAPEAW